LHAAVLESWLGRGVERDTIAVVHHHRWAGSDLELCP
jgi:hypothetical protein